MPASKLQEKNMKKNFFIASLKSSKKGVGSGYAPKCHGSPTLLTGTFFPVFHSTYLLSLGSTLGPEESLDIFPKSTKVNKKYTVRFHYCFGCLFKFSLVRRRWLVCKRCCAPPSSPRTWTLWRSSSGAPIQTGDYFKFSRHK